MDVLFLVIAVQAGLFAFGLTLLLWSRARVARMRRNARIAMVQRPAFLWDGR